MFKTAEDLQTMGKSQIEAATAAAAAVSRGLQQIAAETSAYTKKSVEDGSDAVTRLMGSKSVEGAFQVQADYAKSVMDGAMAQTGKVGALMMAVGKDAFRPFEGALSAFRPR